MSETFDLNITDIRQSEPWAEYLKTIGWTSIRTSSGINIEYIKSGFGYIAKVQRPANLSAEDLAEIDAICISKKVLFVKLEPTIATETALLKTSDYIPSTFPLIPPSTIFLDLRKTEEELWNSISHSGKYAIKRAQREYTKTECIKNPTDEQLQKFHNLAVLTGRKKNFYVQEFKEIQTKARVFGDECFLLFVYDKAGNLASGKYYLGHKNTIWYMHGGTSEDGRKNKAGYELQWQSLKYFKSIGYTTFDQEGVSDPRFPLYTHNWEGLTHFKEKFGGMLVRFPYPGCKIYNPILKKLTKITKMSL